MIAALRALADQAYDLYLLWFVPPPFFFRVDRVRWYEPTLLEEAA
jgi:hypothetical protein